MEIILAAIGGGALDRIGHLVIAWLKNRKEQKRADKIAEARIEALEADKNLKVEQGMALLIDQLQEHQKIQDERIDKMEKQLVRAHARIFQLETVLIGQGIPLPAWPTAA
jgi:hypothetical protein